MTSFDDIYRLRVGTDPSDIERLDLLDMMETLRDLGYDNEEIRVELGDELIVEAGNSWDTPDGEVDTTEWDW